MACITNEILQEYIEGSLTTVEKSMVRDHLIVCDDCRERHEAFESLELTLRAPVFIEPPAVIEQNVLRTLFPRIPSYSSVFALIAASFLLLVTSIYVYFDFANNSLIKAVQLTSQNTSNWIASAVKGVTTIFTAVYAVFKAADRFLEIVLNVRFGAEMIGVVTLVMLLLGLYSVSHLLLNKVKGKN